MDGGVMSAMSAISLVMMGRRYAIASANPKSAATASIHRSDSTGNENAFRRKSATP